MNIEAKHYRSILLIVGLMTALMISGLFFRTLLFCKNETEKTQKIVYEKATALETIFINTKLLFTKIEKQGNVFFK